MSCSCSAIMVKIMLKKSRLEPSQLLLLHRYMFLYLNAKCDLALAGLYYLRA